MITKICVPLSNNIMRHTNKQCIQAIIKAVMNKTCAHIPTILHGTKCANTHQEVNSLYIHAHIHIHIYTFYSNLNLCFSK